MSYSYPVYSSGPVLRTYSSPYAAPPVQGIPISSYPLWEAPAGIRGYRSHHSPHCSNDDPAALPKMLRAVIGNTDAVNNNIVDLHETLVGLDGSVNGLNNGFAELSAKLDMLAAKLDGLGETLVNALSK